MQKLNRCFYTFSFLGRKYGCFPKRCLGKKFAFFHSAFHVGWQNYELLMIMILGNHIRYGWLVNIDVMYIFFDKIFEIERCLGKNKTTPFWGWHWCKNRFPMELSRTIHSFFISFLQRVRYLWILQFHPHYNKG